MADLQQQRQQFNSQSEEEAEQEEEIILAPVKHDELQLLVLSSAEDYMGKDHALLSNRLSSQENEDDGDFDEDEESVYGPDQDFEDDEDEMGYLSVNQGDQIEPQNEIRQFAHDSVTPRKKDLRDDVRSEIAGGYPSPQFDHQDCEVMAMSPARYAELPHVSQPMRPLVPHQEVPQHKEEQQVIAQYVAANLAQYEAYMGAEKVIASSAKPVHGRKRANPMKMGKANRQFNAIQHVLTGGTSSQRHHPQFVMPVDLTPSSLGQTRRNPRAANQVLSKAKAALRSKTVKPAMAEPLPGATQVGQTKPTQSSAQLLVAGNMAQNTKSVDLLVIGAGPAALGLMIAAVKNQRFSELIQDDGVAILDSGISFGGGMLCNYGINSNTSANSFLKCIFRKMKDSKNCFSALAVATANYAQATQSNAAKQKTENEQLPTETPNYIKDIKCGNGKRRQKSVGKERSSQNQIVATTTSKVNQNLQKSLEPAQRFQQFANQPKEQKLEDSESQIVVAQPQDPDMPFQEVSATLQEDQDVSQKVEQETEVGEETLAVSGPQADKIGQLTAERAKHKRTSRRKSRDESTFGGRGPGVRKTQQTSAGRVHSKTTNIRGHASKQGVLAAYNQGANLATSQNNAAALKLQQMRAKEYVERHQQIKEAKKVWSTEDVLTPFKEIFPSNISLLFRRLAKNIVPLSLVGHLLNYVGNHLLHHAFKTTGKRIYMPMHKALSVHLMGNGEIMTQVLKTEFTILTDTSVNPVTFKMVEGQQSVIYYRSKAVVMAGGAQQGLDSRIGSWFPQLAPERLIASDNFLKKWTYLEQLEKLREKKRPKVVIIGGSHSGFSCAWMLLNGPSMYHRCFKMLDEEDLAAGKTTAETALVQRKLPQAPRKSIKNCVPCCTCGIALQIASQKLASGNQNGVGTAAGQNRYQDEQRSQSKAGTRAIRAGLSMAVRELSPVQKGMRHLSKTIKQKKDLASLKQVLPSHDMFINKGIQSPDPKNLNNIARASDLNLLQQVAEPAIANTKATGGTKELSCSCICKCFGYFRYDEWPNIDADEESRLEIPKFSPGDIKILYRDRIKVFFKTAKIAQEAGYTDFDPEDRQKKKKDGYVYPFSGLRGDAKQLYLDVNSGKEDRVSFVKAKTPEQQLKHVEQADLVIWACGYQSNAIKLFDVNKKELELSQKVPNTQFDVDGKNRVMLADGNILNKVFACGVGFPVRTKDGGSGNLDPSKNARADSFSLYMHTVGDVLLKSLLPRKKLAALGCAHKEAANPYLKAATYEQIMKDKKHKGKKPLLQQISTKKERSAANQKLGYLANPIGRLASNNQGKVQQAQTDMSIVDPLQRKVSNVYSTYLDTRGKVTAAQTGGKPKPSGNQGSVTMNQDLHALTGFGTISQSTGTVASKSNCFSYRNNNFEAFDETNVQNVLQTGCSDLAHVGNQELKQEDYCSNLADGEQPTQRVLKFPDIHRESSLVQARDLKQVENSQLKQMIHARSISSLADDAVQKPKDLGEDIDDSDQQYVEIESKSIAFLSNVVAEIAESQNSPILDQKATPQNQTKIAQATTPAIMNGITQVVNAKSPLLLQKKQQMVQSSQATLGQLKQAYNLAKTSVNKASNKGGQKGHGQKSGNIKAVGVDLIKRNSNMFINHADAAASPYLQFGIQQPEKSQKQHHNGGKKALKRAFQEKSSACTVVETTAIVNVDSVAFKDAFNSAYKTNNAPEKHQLDISGKSKDNVQDQIIQNHKAFSEREQLVSSRYKLNGVSNAGALGPRPSQIAMSAGVRMAEHIASADLASQNSQVSKIALAAVNHEQVELNTGLSKNILSAQKMHSIKSVKSNSELFPPIDIKHQPLTQQSLHTTKTKQQFQQKHMRKISANVWQDSQKSLTLSKQMSGQLSHSDFSGHHQQPVEIGEPQISLDAATTAMRQPLTQQTYQGPLGNAKHQTANATMKIQSLNPRQKLGSYLATNNNRNQNVGTNNKAQQSSSGQSTIGKIGRSSFLNRKTVHLQTSQNMMTAEDRRTENVSVPPPSHKPKSSHFDNMSQTGRKSQASSSKGNTNRAPHRKADLLSPMTVIDHNQPDKSDSGKICKQNAKSGFEEDTYSVDEFNDREDREMPRDTAENIETEEHHQLPEQTYIRSAVDRQHSHTVKSQRKNGGLFKKDLSKKTSTVTAREPVDQDDLVGSPKIMNRKSSEMQETTYEDRDKLTTFAHPQVRQTTPTKYESVKNSKTHKAGDLTPNASAVPAKANTPSRPATSKRIQDLANTNYGKNAKHLSQNLGVRRNGTTSAADIQQSTSKLPQERAMQKQRNSVVKKTAANTANNVGMLDKSAQLRNQPYLDTSLYSVAQQHSSHLTTTKPAHQLQQNRLNKLSMRQRQITENRDAKFKHLLQGQIKENPGTSAMRTSQGKPDASLQTPSKDLRLADNNKASRANNVGKMATVNAALADSNEMAEKNNKNSYQLVTTPFNAKKQQYLGNSSSKEVTSNVYKNGFFVHKTIRELAIKPDLDFPTDHEGATDDYKQTQINAARKEVQQRAANLSPVLKNRSTSKAGLKSVQQPQTTSNAVASGKYKSPLRTTLKSSVSMASHKETKPQPSYTASKTPMNQQQHLSSAGLNPQASNGLRSPKSLRRHPINSLTMQGLPMTEHPSSRLKDLGLHVTQQ